MKKLFACSANGLGPDGFNHLPGYCVAESEEDAGARVLEDLGAELNNAEVRVLEIPLDVLKSVLEG